jgi:DNA-binding phage protein
MPDMVKAGPNSDSAVNQYQERVMNPLDKSMDDKIRAALRSADRKGQLSTVAAVTGIAGGVTELRKIMGSTGELHIMDRGMLGMHLGAA